MGYVSARFLLLTNRRSSLIFFDKIGNRTYFYIDEISIFYSLIKYNSITGLYFIVYYKIIFCSIKI